MGPRRGTGIRPKLNPLEHWVGDQHGRAAAAAQLGLGSQDDGVTARQRTEGTAAPGRGRVGKAGTPDDPRDT